MCPVLYKHTWTYWRTLNQEGVLLIVFMQYISLAPWQFPYIWHCCNSGSLCKWGYVHADKASKKASQALQEGTAKLRKEGEIVLFVWWVFLDTWHIHIVSCIISPLSLFKAAEPMKQLDVWNFHPKSHFRMKEFAAKVRGWPDLLWWFPASSPQNETQSAQIWAKGTYTK
jgi:hypothetical protein